MSREAKSLAGGRPAQRKPGGMRRRQFLGAAVVGAAAATGPWYLKRSLASSGELNLFSWSDYVYPEMIEGFEKQTGIKVNLAVYGSNDEVLSKLRATQGKGYDIVYPAVTLGPVWYQSGDLLQPLDESKLNVDQIIPSLYEKSITLGATYRGKRMLLPYNWGSEAIVYNAEERDYTYGELSYGTLWDEENKGRVLARTSSALVGIGLYLDATGEVPSNRLLDVYKGPDDMRRLYEQYLAYAIARKPWIQNFWENAQQTLTAFQQDNCVIGQCWDGPGIRMMKETGGKIRYLMPKEGGLAWLDTMGIPSGAENVEQAYAWMNYVLTPELGGIFANLSGYNSAVKGAAKHLAPDQQKAFEDAYPGDAIDKLWWWQPEDSWYVSISEEFAERFRVA